jgi:hypothetical protein
MVAASGDLNIISGLLLLPNIIRHFQVLHVLNRSWARGRGPGASHLVAMQALSARRPIARLVL